MKSVVKVDKNDHQIADKLPYRHKYEGQKYVSFEKSKGYSNNITNNR